VAVTPEVEDRLTKQSKQKNTSAKEINRYRSYPLHPWPHPELLHFVDYPEQL